METQARPAYGYNVTRWTALALQAVAGTWTIGMTEVANLVAPPLQASNSLHTSARDPGEALWPRKQRGKVLQGE